MYASISTMSLVLMQVVRDLEGLGIGQGIFARDRAYQKSLQDAAQHGNSSTKAEVRLPAAGEDSGSDCSEDEDEGEQMLESGGRDRCAYFFWQGEREVFNVQMPVKAIWVDNNSGGGGGGELGGRFNLLDKY